MKGMEWLYSSGNCVRDIIRGTVEGEGSITRTHSETETRMESEDTCM
jgi:hypothetical protein